MRYCETRTDFFEVLILSNFIEERLPNTLSIFGDETDVYVLMELATRLTKLSCQLFQKERFTDTLLTTKAVIEVVAAMYIIYRHMKLNRSPLSWISTDPKMVHFIRWIKSGGSQMGNPGETPHPMIASAIKHLDDWLGGIRWQYDALAEFSKAITANSNGMGKKTENTAETALPPEYTMGMISKILVNFLTIGIVLYDEIALLTETNMRKNQPQFSDYYSSVEMRLARAV